MTLVTSTDDTTSSETTKETTVSLDEVTHVLEISKSYKNITKSKLYLKATTIGGIIAYKQIIREVSTDQNIEVKFDADL